MTLREKLEIEHPECVDEKFNGGCKDCPSMYGYCSRESDMCDCKTCNDELCRKCWDQQYEGELTPQEKKIEELERQIKVDGAYKVRIRSDRDDLRKRLSELRNHFMDKTGIYCVCRYDDEYVRIVFDDLLKNRDYWRTSCILSWIGFVVASIIIAIGG